MTDMRDVFDARAYLRRYFIEPDEEDRVALKFWIDHVRRLPQGAHVLEYGGGPALYSVLTLVRRAESIHFSDFVPASLDEVRKWIAKTPDAHDWSPYSRMILELEGTSADAVAVQARETALRRAMTHLSEGDARTEAMLDEVRPPYDAITAHHCLDVAARDVPDFKRMVRHLSSMLSPGGLFLLSITTGTTRYTVDGTVFACLDLKLGEVRAALVEAGLDSERIAHVNVAVEGDEYTHMLLSAGWKM